MEMGLTESECNRQRLLTCPNGGIGFSVNMHSKHIYLANMRAKRGEKRGEIQIVFRY